MKTHRMSRNTEDRNGHKAMKARGRASLSRGALFNPDRVLTGRSFRRANRLTHAEVAVLNTLISRPDGSPILPTVAMDMDERTRMITGWHLISI
ncbi:hypothetical protein [Sphingomonas bacterium]|uniref:hypothetical protein n=1 Tax=Sphingomonas bacterium TaxID=1895847 RepID=UPI001576F0EC|nr:hypothetical protein [Sphingomonas bacterium]